MTKEETISRLKIEQGNLDAEVAHCAADNILCELLISLGYKEVVDEFNLIDKWYG